MPFLPPIVAREAQLEGSPTVNLSLFRLTGPFEVRAFARSRGRSGRGERRRARITDSNFKQPWRIARVLWSAPGRPSANFKSRPPRGERSAGRRGGLRDPRWMAGETIRGTLCEGVPSLLFRREAPPGAPLAAFYRCAGRAFENVDQPRLSASSWRQVVVPASGAPPSPGSERLRSPPPAAPHRSTAGFPGGADR
jgi:hypothetical protein